MNRQYGAFSGIAVVLIVLNHALHFGQLATPVQGSGWKFTVGLQALGVFAVPVFLFISGAFLSYAAGALSFRFLRSSLERILWPYVIWSAIFYVVVYLTGDLRQSASGYLKSLAVGYPYHFVPLLAFWYLAAPLVAKAGRRHALVLLTGIALYQGLLLAIRFPDVFGSGALPGWLHLIKPVGLFVPMSDWAIYVPLGLVLSMHDRAVKRSLLKGRWFAGTASAALFVLGLLDAFNVMHAPWARFLAPLPLMFVLPAIERASIPWTRAFEFLGKRSYGIYLIHFVVIVLLFALTRITGDGLASRPGLLFPALFFLALGTPLAILDVSARGLIPSRIYRYVFGLPYPAERARRTGSYTAVAHGSCTSSR